MAKVKYYPEEELIDMMQKGEIGWLDYVNHHSPEWQQEYTDYCTENGFNVCEESAEDFVQFKDKQLEEAMENGDA